MDSSHEDNFLFYYQKLLFNEQDADSYQLASIRRKCMAQMFKASIPLSNNMTTCLLYERNLKSYLDVVDDQNDVNNYAEAIQSLLSFSQPECNMWKSSLGVESNKEVSLCNSHVVGEEDIEFLVQACSLEKFEDKDISVKIPSTSAGSSKVAVNESKPIILRKRKDIDMECEKEQVFPKKFSMKNEEDIRVNLFSNGTTSNSLRNGYNSVRNPPEIFQNTLVTRNLPETFQNLPEVRNSVRNPPEVSGKTGSWIPKTSTGNCGKPPSYNITYNTLRHHDAQVQNTINTPSHSSNETKYQKQSNGFSTAREELIVQNQKKWGSRNPSGYDCGAPKKSLGSTRRNVMNKFVPPVKPSEEEYGGMSSHQESVKGNEEFEDERLKGIDPKMAELIRNEIMDSGAPVHWDDIAGLQFAKTTIQEIVVWPMLRPEIFTGLRRPPKGILLFGPPGTGKTLIGKCIASQSLSTFFSISASSLTSKWIGDGEKMVRALFAVARCHQPAVIFIDEIDSLLTQRSDTEHESSRRIKTEFLVQLDGATTGEEDRILVVGATNRPQELDEAARRRLVKRLYIPLPDHEARCQIIQRLMFKENSCLSEEQINEIGKLTDGYSGADVKNLCQEASLGPIRSINFMDIQNISPEEVRPISFEDFQHALKRVRASVSSCDLDVYLKWDKTYGSG